MMLNGWIKLYRKIMDSSLWMLSSDELRVAIALMVMANLEDKEWFSKWHHKRILIRRGELITSLSHLSTACNLSIRKIRTALKNLAADGFIVVLNVNEKATRQFSHIKICKYETYQDLKSGKRHANDTPPAHETTTTKEYRIKNKEEEYINTGHQDGLFVSFWGSYPNKVKKERALRAWNKLNEEEQNKAVNAVIDQLQWPPRFGGLSGPPESVPHPASWINAKSWEDAAPLQAPKRVSRTLELVQKMERESS